jgi:dTDP-4-amino-4,6-dideoxygalactose transaminase
MHIRINIPSWGFREYREGLRSLIPIQRDYYLDRLTKEIQNFVGDRNIYLLSSGRFAVYAAIKYLNLIRPRVAIPAYACPSVLEAIRKANAEPVFIDVKQKSIRFDSCSLMTKIQNEQIDVVVATNTYGLDQDYAMLSNSAVPVIEDSAYQAGCELNNSDVKCGLRCPIGVWSFNFKSITSIGGGVLLTKEKMGDLDNLAHPLLRSNLAPRYMNYMVRSLLKTAIPKFLPGAATPQTYNIDQVREQLLHIDKYGMTNLQAAVAYTQWVRRDILFNRQRQNSGVLQEAVKKCWGVSVLNEQENETLVHLFPILLEIDAPDIAKAVLEFRRLLYQRSIQTETPYPIGHIAKETHPNVHDLASRLILVPCNASLGLRQIRYTADALSAVSAKMKNKYGG